MAKESVLPVDQQYFTIAELAGLGLTYYRINKLVQEGRLIKLDNKLYKNTAFEGDEPDLYVKDGPGSLKGNAATGMFLPAILTSETCGMQRSVVHYVIPSCCDALQLVQIGVQTTEPGYSFGPAIRDHDQIHFVLSGKGDVTINHQRFSVSEGQMFYTPEGSMWYLESDEASPWRYMWIGFCGEWGKRLLDGIGINQKRLTADIADISMARKLSIQLAEAMKEDTSYIGMMPCFWRIIQELMRTKGYVPHSKKRPESRKEKQHDARIVEIVRRIERDYMSEITVNELAAELSVSRAWLSRCFKEVTGKTIKEYVTDLRISHAKDLLTQTPIPIAEVAAACGYADAMFFSRMFKKVTGCTPSQWRAGNNGRMQFNK